MLRHHRVTATLVGALASVAVVAASLVAAPPAHAAAPSYVALGDSYSSGVGTRTYLSDGTSCQRSVYAFPSLIAAAKGYALNFRACSGAKVSDVTATQLSALSASTSYVTISVGGNDAGFTSVITTCAEPAWLSDCSGAVRKAQGYITGTLPGSLATLYSSIRTKAPNAKVVVVGYPRLFNGEDCNALTWFSPTDESQLNATADLMNKTLAAAAAARGFAFVNPTTAFIGHAVCGDPEWLNGLSNPVSESYHPNRTGHSSGYTPLVGPQLTGSPVAVTAAVLTKARAQGPALAAQQRQYAAADRHIRPETFTIPRVHAR
jgi:lysophospholipase L1-like esterase